MNICGYCPCNLFDRQWYCPCIFLSVTKALRLEEILCCYCPLSLLDRQWCHLTVNILTMNGRGYFWLLSLQLFISDHGTMTGRGYLLVLSLQIFVICHGTMTDRGYLWVSVLSLQIFVIGTMTGRGYLWLLSLQIFIIDHELLLEEVICWCRPCHWWVFFLKILFEWQWRHLTSNSERWKYDWKRLFVGTVPANICYWPWTMTGRGYLSVLSLQIFVIGGNCPYWQWYHLTVNHGTMTGRGYFWVLSL